MSIFYWILVTSRGKFREIKRERAGVDEGGYELGGCPRGEVGEE